jgi:hypothetical protein
MKHPVTKPAKTTPEFQITIRKRIAKSDAPVKDSKTQKRDNTFSKSRDTREDRGRRQVKTSQSSQTFSHGQ